jgi:hypothetical protein
MTTRTAKPLQCSPDQRTLSLSEFVHMVGSSNDQVAMSPWSRLRDHTLALPAFAMFIVLVWLLFHLITASAFGVLAGSAPASDAPNSYIAPGTSLSINTPPTPPIPTFTPRSAPPRAAANGSVVPAAYRPPRSVRGAPSAYRMSMPASIQDFDTTTISRDHRALRPLPGDRAAPDRAECLSRHRPAD